MSVALRKRVPDAPRGKKRGRPERGKSESKRPATAKSSRRGSVGGTGATRKRASRETVEKAPSPWWSRGMILCALLSVVVAGGQGYRYLRSLPVEHIAVSGELEHTQAEAVQKMVQATLDGGFLTANLEQMRAELEGLPWIYEATVRRRWPQTLEIYVLEQFPIARWGEEGFLNHEGGIFVSDKKGDWAALPLLRGPQGSAPGLMARYLRLREMLVPLNLELQQLSMDERGQLEAVLNGDTRLLLGGEKLRERMQRFAAIYRRELAPQITQIERIDLRYATGLAVAYFDTEPSHVAGL